MTRHRFPGFGIVLTGIATISLALTASAAPETTARPATFSKDVAPIFQQKCQERHQPNCIAPMSLITFEEARPWARAIRQRVITRQMPPWHIDPSVGVHKFKNDMSLSPEQIDTIVRWVDSGALEGDPKDLPPPKALVTDNEWQGVRDGFGPPDLVIRSSEYTMPARHQDVWYRPMSDLPLTEPRWGEDGRDPSHQFEGTPDRAPLDRPSGSQQRSRCCEHRYCEWLLRRHGSHRHR
jgi:hypothetical protein